MATTTTNFGWDIPQSTDLVKDGATAIATLGQDIDTAFVDLKGGTTGQILSKASATDLDYTWVSANPGDITAVTAGTGISGGGTSGDVTITNSMATAIDAKGDLIAGTGADAFARLAIGTNNQVLTADSTAATGIKWADPAGFTFAAYTPTYTNISIGNGTVTARYGQSGKFVTVNWKLVWGSTTSITGSLPKISLPVTALNTGSTGTAYLLDAATLEQFGLVRPDSTTTMQIIAPQTSGYGMSQIGATFPWTWTTNDEIRISLVYEAA